MGLNYVYSISLPVEHRSNETARHRLLLFSLGLLFDLFPPAFDFSIVHGPPAAVSRTSLVFFPVGSTSVHAW